MPSDSYRPRSRSPRRSRSPPPSSRNRRDDRDDDRYSNRRDEGRDRAGATDYGREDQRGGHSSRGGGGGYDRDSRGGGSGRRRSRSPVRGAAPPAPSGDGGWGRQRQRSDSPGRPSKALAEQRDLVPGGGARDVGEGGEDKKEYKHVEPDFKPSGALAAETKCVFSFPFVFSNDVRALRWEGSIPRSPRSVTSGEEHECSQTGMLSGKKKVERRIRRTGLTPPFFYLTALSTVSFSSTPNRPKLGNRSRAGGCTCSRGRNKSVRG
jgi:hypothetical protein